LDSPDRSFAGRVIAWQARAGRHDLPWQNTRDPYRVWLSEVMLQQTQVATVRAYFARFVAELPTVATLAAASEDQVLGLWSGLGYYSRARNLHRCAKEVVSRHGGRFPERAELLQTLPGIGRSTAAAITSLCFGERVAILDANVRRVLTRVLGFDGDLASARSERELWSLAESLLPSEGQSAAMPRYTQGMMDLGATVCLPKAPACEQCPVAADCRARAVGAPERYPVRSRKLRRTALSQWLLWLQRPDGAVWLERRPAPGVWAGLYSFPAFPDRQALERAPGAWLPERAEDLPVVKHVLTHKDLYLHVVRYRAAADAAPPLAGQWFTAAEWPGLGLPAPVRQWLTQACSQPKDVDG